MGAGYSMRNKITKHFIQSQSLPQVRLKSVLKTRSHYCFTDVENPITHILQYGRPRQKQIKVSLTKEFPVSPYVTVCAYFSVAVLEDRYNSTSTGNLILQHISKIHHRRVVIYTFKHLVALKRQVTSVKSVRQHTKHQNTQESWLTIACIKKQTSQGKKKKQLCKLR